MTRDEQICRDILYTEFVGIREPFIKRWLTKLTAVFLLMCFFAGCLALVESYEAMKAKYKKIESKPIVKTSVEYPTNYAPDIMILAKNINQGERK